MESKDILAKIDSKVSKLILDPPRPIIHPKRDKSTMPKGRPKGVKNSYKSRWTPRKWKVDHEMIVLMHINGKSNVEIAGLLNRSPVWISWVINCDHAKEMIQRVKDNLPALDQTEKYDRILCKATDRLTEYLENDKLAQSTPGAMTDRAMRAMEMIDKRLSKLSSSSSTVTNNTLVLATEANIDKLTNAMMKSDEVTRLHRVVNE